MATLSPTATLASTRPARIASTSPMALAASMTLGYTGTERSNMGTGGTVYIDLYPSTGVAWPS